jgi:hypothetical protein
LNADQQHQTDAQRSAPSFQHQRHVDRHPVVEESGAWSSLLNSPELDGDLVAKNKWGNGGGHKFSNSYGSGKWKNGKGGNKWSNSRNTWGDGGYHGGWRNGGGAWGNGGGGFVNW